MHEFSIMGESAKHLIEMNILGVEERAVVNFRNLVVHHYFGLDVDEVWETIQNALPPFKKKVANKILEIDALQRKQLMDKYLENFPQPLMKEIFEPLSVR